ncbi:MAG: glucose-6-phosphate dehydrogenase [Anaerolineaceae bacterium]|nr:glucose-6-phosphate dehydrogenase [Anaerolineaceae bacterium]
MKNSTTIVIFGASGDLTKRKLIPALFNLYRKGRMPSEFSILGFAGTSYKDDTFCAMLRENLAEHADYEFTDEEWQTFAPHLHYHTDKAIDPESFERLKGELERLEKGPANRLFYLATPPQFFPTIVEGIGRIGLTKEEIGWRRVVVEKPFGTDLKSALELNQALHEYLREHQIYRIDHYLGKETVQNILYFRFANTIFEPVWNRNYIDHVQITVAEEVGVEHRGGYYDEVGILRDMFQNHLLQLLTLVAMEPPSSFKANALREERAKVLSAIRPIPSDRIWQNSVLGQYRGYRQEYRVSANSHTATYAALRLHIDNWRWQGVPFYLRSGKLLKEKASEILIQFKQPPLAMFPVPEWYKMVPNILALCIQPNESIHLRFEAKAPDTAYNTRSVNMEFNYEASFGPGTLPEAYERLLLDSINGDASLFIRGDQTEISWGIIDPFIHAWDSPDAPPLSIYTPGSMGPAEADRFIEYDGRNWLRGCIECCD